MAERRVALAGLSAAAYEPGGTTLRELVPASIVQVQAWPDTLAAVDSVVSGLLGVASPAIGNIAGNEETTVAAIAPGRFLIRSQADGIAERLAGGLPASDGTVTDLSHGRTILRLEGDAAGAILAKCVALDLDPAIFPPGRVAQTAIHHIDVVLLRSSASRFDLWVLRSFAEALAEWLLDASAEARLTFTR
jgi:methylglutamate dehydrogenase subunit D